jgi:ketosteroid isomerase-like protein
MMKSFPCVALLGIVSTLANAGETAARIPADLAARVHAYDDAQIKGDEGALRDLLADDYVLVNSRGHRQTKAELIADYTKPGFKLQPFTVEEPVDLVWSDGAVMGGVATLRGIDDGQSFEVRLRFSDIWAKRQGKWRVIYTHASRDPK